MKIVVLDGHALNPGDLSWDGLRELGDCVVHERTPPEFLLERAADAAILLTNKTRLDRSAIDALPHVKYIGVLATGYDVVDVRAASERGIAVTNVPSYGSASVAQLTFALILELTHRVGHHAQQVRDARWHQSRDWCFWDYPLLELSGLTLGVIGFGNIGREVAQIGRAFGMKIMAFSPTLSRRPGGQSDVQATDLETLFREADVVTLHCPMTAETRGIVNAQRLLLMKKTAFLINTSRGALVVEQDLADALNTNRIAGAAVDVLSVEPPVAANPLPQAKNCIITPHIAWATRAARTRLLTTAIENLRSFLAGRAENVIN